MTGSLTTSLAEKKYENAHGEIGRLLGIPEGTARSDLFHARLALRRALRALREIG